MKLFLTGFFFKYNIKSKGRKKSREIDGEFLKYT